MQNLIQIENLHKRFGKTDAVNDLSLEVPEGRILAFLGPNGAGKTTTIKTILNLYQPDKGRAVILGQDSRKLGPEQFRSIGYVSENQDLPEWMTVGKFIDYCKPMYPTWDDDFCARLLKQFDLPLDRKLKALSRGMKMKAALLSSLVYRPKLVVLDEPFTGLDPLVRDEFIRGMLELTEQEGWTVFISSHDIDEVERLCDSIAVIDGGRLKLSESVDELQARFRRVDVHCEGTIDDPQDRPAPWRHFEVLGRTASFTHQQFQGDDTLRAELDKFFPGVERVRATPLSLREIFIAMARDYRLEHTGGDGSADTLLAAGTNGKGVSA